MLQSWAGCGLVILSFCFFSIASYLVLFSAFLPTPTSSLLNSLVEDSHYKYLAVLIVPTSAYFIIANWVGWQYYQNS
ncbi:hypothetical protein AMATHDRAFT_135272 [Amanita thiersii Skay4041]|uniref:PIG-P domain-containing protein n=1 Tax=Amanita thiersii Skay4041 TaxID=703135 RepID=A0A2A9P1F4_9AGAR|nr:hypothetical protein AMATHDRAFT_135272 [Amanita thiersii Skay4041]